MTGPHDAGLSPEVQGWVHWGLESPPVVPRGSGGPEWGEPRRLCFELLAAAPVELEIDPHTIAEELVATSEAPVQVVVVVTPRGWLAVAFRAPGADHLHPSVPGRRITAWSEPTTIGDPSAPASSTHVRAIADAAELLLTLGRFVGGHSPDAARWTFLIQRPPPERLRVVFDLR